MTSIEKKEESLYGEAVGGSGVASKRREPDCPSPATLAIVLIALFGSMFLIALDMSIIATAIPRITAQFHSLDQVGWYGSAFGVTLAAFVNFWGKALKYLNKKWTLLAAIFVFELGSLVCGKGAWPVTRNFVPAASLSSIAGVAPNSSGLIAGRAVQGAGGAGMSTGVYTILACIVPSSRVPLYMGLTGVVFSVSSILGPVIGGALTQHATWRWCFFINLPIGGVCAALLLLFLHLPSQAGPQHVSLGELLLNFDFPGIICLLGSLICLFLALELGGVSRSWGDADVIGTLVGFGVLAVVFFLLELWQGEKAMVVPRIFRRRIIASCALFIFCNNASGFAVNYNLPIYFQAVNGVGPAESGVRVLPSVLSVSLFTLIGAGMVGKVGWVQPFLISGAILSALGRGLIYTFDLTTPAREWIGYQIITGIGFGLTIQVPVVAAQMTAEPSDISLATATVLLFQFLGMAVGVSTAQNIFNNRLIELMTGNVPGVEPAEVLAVGAYNLRIQFRNPAQLHQVLLAYVSSLKAAWIFSTAVAGLAFVIAFLPPWRSMKAHMSRQGE